MTLDSLPATAARLEQDYCPPLDPALLSAILSDYDLSSAEDVRAATQILDELKESAGWEEQTDFDPSGTGAQSAYADVDTDAAASKEERHAASNPEASASSSPATDLTSVSNDMSYLSLGESAEEDEEKDAMAGHARDLETLDQDTKVSLLQDVFGDLVSLYTIKHTLNKCGGRWQMAMEELLSHVYLNGTEYSEDGTKISSKGVDGFSEDKVYKRVPKAKGKNQRSKRTTRLSSFPTSPTTTAAIPASNRWKSASEDIEFISSRTRIASATVHSLYYEHNASVSRTIAALLKMSMEESKHVVTDDTAVMKSAQALGREYPSVTPEYLAAIIRLTHPSTSAAHELAEALTARPKMTSSGVIQVIPRYAPIMLNDDNTSPGNLHSKTHSPTALLSSTHLDPHISAYQASAYNSARLAALSQARAAHRKAKSNHLMGGAAAYYGELGREYAAMSSNASAAAADSLAASQSSSNHVDLHGVDVLNAVRIAQARIHAWWVDLGENRVNGRVGAADRSSGFRVIVGLGRHSEGGRGKLGPAVSKMLRQDGWKFENAGGVIVVSGRAR
nr:smr domain-containing protein [Quercus suber]